MNDTNCSELDADGLTHEQQVAKWGWCACRLNDNTYYGDCCFCGEEVIGFVCADDELGICHPDCPKEEN